MKYVTTRILGPALATLVLIASAYASSVEFLPGDHPQPMEQNILFNKGTDHTGFSSHGFTDHTHTLVNYTSATELLGKGGQSDIDAANGGVIQDLTITVPGHEFKDFIMNPFKDTTAGSITVDVFTTQGEEVDHFDNSTHGNNFLTIVATGTNEITKIEIKSPTGEGFHSFMQPRISGISGVTVVPEPSSLLLLGSGPARIRSEAASQEIVLNPEKYQYGCGAKA